MGKLGQNFLMWKGDDKILSFNIEDATSLEVGYSAEWTMCLEEPNENNSYNPTRLLSKSTSDTPPAITFSEATVYIAIEGILTGEASSISPGMYYHELKLYDNEGNEAIAAVGTVDLRSPTIKRTI